MTESFADLESEIGNRIGISVIPISPTATDPTVFGSWDTGPAWSTMKVPISQATIDNGVANPELMQRAITQSDNDAAKEMWASLGDPTSAGAKVQAVLAGHGDPSTQVETDQIRPPFTGFGQTDWSLADQTRFLSKYAQDPAGGPVRDLMGQVTGDQQFGLGRIDGAQFKGGWGPTAENTGDTEKPYQVRQMGIIDTPQGPVAVAMAVDGKSFKGGQGDLDKMADWVKENAGQIAYGKHSDPKSAPTAAETTKPEAAGDNTISITDRSGFPAKIQAIKDASTSLRDAGDALGRITAAANKEASSFTAAGTPAPVYADLLAGLNSLHHAVTSATNAACDSANNCADTAMDKFTKFTGIDDAAAAKIRAV